MKIITLTLFITLSFFYSSYAQVTDIDGNVYQTTRAGVQHLRYGTVTDGSGKVEVTSDSLLIWMSSNLNVSRFRNGELIKEAKTNEEWENALRKGIPAWCYVNNDSTTGKSLGKLYNYYAVTSLKELAPQGWHIATDYEWILMYEQYNVHVTEANLYEDEKIFMSTNWKSGYNWGNGTNKIGFNALPTSYRVPGGFPDGPSGAYFWFDISLARDQKGGFHQILGDRYIGEFGTRMTYEFGFSVRCVKDW